MSPFFDSKAELVKSLYNQYKPNEIRLIIEEGFGTLPKKKNIPDYVKLYRWDKIGKVSGRKYQDFFHAKCFFFEGEHYHYMLCGSANASVAAFGIPGAGPTNQEASVGFKSATTDYFKNTCFVLTEPVKVEDITESNTLETTNCHTPVAIWIKEASYIYNNYDITVENTEEALDATITFYTGDRKTAYSTRKRIKSGSDIISGNLKESMNPLYVEITNSKGELISNRQFVIPTEIMDVNNPSPESERIRVLLKPNKG